MEDPSDRLRRDQESQNRQREHNSDDRRHFVDSLGSRWRINRLTEQIEAEKRKKSSDEAFEAMSAGWPEARAAIERCVWVAPDVRASWLKWFDAIRFSGNSSQSRSLDELESEVNARASALSGISADLGKAVEGRGERTALNEFMLHLSPTRRRSRLHTGVLPTEMWPLAPGAYRRADDLQPIHDRILLTSIVPNELRFTWLDRLDKIDRRGTGAEGPSAIEKIEALASDIDAAAAALRSVGAALGYQASKCRSFWRR